MLKKLTLGLTIVAALLALSAVLADKYLLRARYEEPLAAHEAAARLALPRFAALRDDPALALPWLNAAGDDAGPWLNPRLPWQSSTGVAPAALQVPEPLRSQVKSWGKDWLAKGRDAELPALDLAWLGELRKYGHWSLVPGGPLEHGPLRWLHAPLPGFVDLLAFAKLRLLQAAKAGAGMEEAAAEVEHLAVLCGSTETLLGEMVGLALRSAASEARGQGVPATQETHKRLLRAAVMYGTVLVDDATWAQAFPADRPVPGRCTALNEALGTTLWLRHLVAEPYAGRFARLDAALAAPPPGCRLELGRRMAETVKAMKDPYLEMLDTSDGGASTGLEGLAVSGPLGLRTAMVLLAMGADADGVRSLLEPKDAGP